MPSDALLASTDVEDAIAQLYVRAVAAKAGYVTSVPEFDRDCIDMVVSAGGAMRPSVAMQLKATINLAEIGDSKELYSFQCPKRAYDLLRLPSITPRLLVVMRLPRDPSEWLSLKADELIVRHCAYWISLLGAPSLDIGKESKAVHLPKTNRLDLAGLQGLMEQARTGKIT